MAVDSVVRWQLVRDVIVHRKTGVIVVQMGKNYLNWTIENGNLIYVSSTFPEATLTKFIQEKQLTEATTFQTAQMQIDRTQTLGALLIRKHMVEPEDLAQALHAHWISCIDYFFDPAAHLFWSTSGEGTLPEIFRCDRPLGDVLLYANKNCIAIPTALRVVYELKPPFKVQSQNVNVSSFTEEDQRIWMHLQSGNSLKQILQDESISRIPCYKTLFLLWLTGTISDSRRSISLPATKVSVSLLQRIPPEWVIPLCAGALIGALLTPSPAPPIVPSTPAAEQREESPDPTWSPPNDDQDLTQRHRDTETKKDE